MRIISLCPSNTEILHAIGVDPIAVDDSSDYPPDLDVPKLGPDLSIDLDKVEALDPDLVLASLSVPGMEKNVEGLKERGIPYTIVKNPEQLLASEKTSLVLCTAYLPPAVQKGDIVDVEITMPAKSLTKSLRGGL